MSIFHGTNVTAPNPFEIGVPPMAEPRVSTLANNTNATLSAINSGSLQAMLFFQDRNAPTGLTESSGNNASQHLAT